MAGVGYHEFGVANPVNLTALLKECKCPATDKLDPVSARAAQPRSASSPPSAPPSLSCILGAFNRAARLADESGAVAEHLWLRSVIDWYVHTDMTLAARNQADARFFREQVLRPSLVTLLRSVRGEDTTPPMPPAVLNALVPHWLGHSQRTAGLSAARAGPYADRRPRSPPTDRRRRTPPPRR